MFWHLRRHNGQETDQLYSWLAMRMTQSESIMWSIIRDKGGVVRFKSGKMTEAVVDVTVKFGKKQVISVEGTSSNIVAGCLLIKVCDITFVLLNP